MLIHRQCMNDPSHKNPRLPPFTHPRPNGPPDVGLGDPGGGLGAELGLLQDRGDRELLEDLAIGAREAWDSDDWT